MRAQLQSRTYSQVTNLTFVRFGFAGHGPLLYLLRKGLHSFKAHVNQGSAELSSSKPA